MDVLVYVAVGAVAAALVALVLAFRKLREVKLKVELFGGSYDLTAVKRMSPDAYAFILDYDSKTGYWVPLHYRGGYYVFRLKGRVGVFMPIERTIFAVAGRPLYVGVRIGDTAFEAPLDLVFKLKLASRNKDLAELKDKSFTYVIQRLSELAGRPLVEKLTAVDDVLLDVTPEELFGSIVEHLSHGVSSTIASLRNLAETVVETGGAIEKKLPAKELGSLLVYVAVAGFVVSMVVFVLKLAGFW